MTNLGETVGRDRANGLYRLIFLVILAVGGIAVLGIIFTLGVIAGVVFHVIDVLMRIILDKSFSEGGTIGSWTMALWRWPIDMLAWLFFGDRPFPWTPMASM